MRWTIRTKLILAIGLPLLAVYLFMVRFMVNQLQARNLRRLEERAGEAAAGTAARVGGRLALAARSADTLALFISTLPGAPEPDLAGLAAAVVERDPLIFGCRVGWNGRAEGPPAVAGAQRRDSGVVSLPIPPLFGGPAPEWIELPRTRGVGVWTEPYTEAAGGAWIVSYSAPIRKDSAVIGVVRIDLLLESLARRLGPLPLPEGDFTLVSGKGRILIGPSGPGGEPEDVARLARSRNRPDLLEGSRRLLRGETGVAQAEGLLRSGRRWFAFAPVPDTGWFFLQAVPEETVLAFSRGQLHLGLAILAAGLVLILSVVVAMASRITRPLARLSAAVTGLGTGDLDTRVTGVTGRDEIGDLAAAFNRMVGDLKGHVEALNRETSAREKVEGEIRVARQIQTALLPKKVPTGEGFDLHAVNLPARRVAGDFYDCFLRDGKTLVFLIADVSGKGVPAALFMAVARTVLRDVLGSGDSLSAAVERANTLLEKDSPGSMYVTLFAAAYDPATGSFRYVNGGHPPPYRLDRAGRVSPFGEVGGPMVGLLPGTKYTEGSGRLEPGDRLVLFTDGVPEATSPGEEFFGEERFERLLAEGKDDDAAGLCRRVVGRVEAFQEGTRYDDLTLVVLGRR